MRTLRTLAAGVCMALATVCGAATPDTYELRPVTDAGLRWDAIGIAIVFLLVTAVVGFKNARRTHLD